MARRRTWTSTRSTWRAPTTRSWRSELEIAAADNLKRVLRPTAARATGRPTPGSDRMTAFLETKTVWHPTGSLGVVRLVVLTTASADRESRPPAPSGGRRGSLACASASGKASAAQHPREHPPAPGRRRRTGLGDRAGEPGDSGMSTPLLCGSPAPLRIARSRPMSFTGAACRAAAILLIAAGDTGTFRAAAESADAVAARRTQRRGGGREGGQGARGRGVEGGGVSCHC